MDRRRFAQTLTAALTLGTAGCLVNGDDNTEKATGKTNQIATADEDRPTSAPVSASVDDAELPIPRSEMRNALPRDYIPAIVEPAFGTDWSGLDGEEQATSLPDDAAVLGVQRDGRARAYPLRILNHHEVINDELDGPLAVTYCVLCGSGIVFERRVDGEPTTFGVSGKLWRSALVMYDDRTESLWSQISGTAINGPRTGEELDLLSSTLTTWGEWQTAHPETRVLLPPPHSEAISEYERSFDYFSPKYSYDDEAQLVGRDSYDGDLHPKTMVIGIESGGITRAYPFHVVETEDVILDHVGDLPVVIATSPDGTPVAYDRRIEGEPREFEADGQRHLLAAGSRWERPTGRAVDGPHEGQKLTRANDTPPMFWLGWSKFNPATEVYGVERSDD